MAAFNVGGHTDRVDPETMTTRALELLPNAAAGMSNETL